MRTLAGLDFIVTDTRFGLCTGLKEFYRLFDAYEKMDIYREGAHVRFDDDHLL